MQNSQNLYGQMKVIICLLYLKLEENIMHIWMIQSMATRFNSKVMCVICFLWVFLAVSSLCVLRHMSQALGLFWTFSLLNITALVLREPIECCNLRYDLAPKKRKWDHLFYADLGLTPAQLSNQVQLAMRKNIARYYDCQLRSDDELQSQQTRNISIRTQARFQFHFFLQIRFLWRWTKHKFFLCWIPWFVSLQIFNGEVSNPHDVRNSAGSTICQCEAFCKGCFNFCYCECQVRS